MKKSQKKKLFIDIATKNLALSKIISVKSLAFMIRELITTKYKKVGPGVLSVPVFYVFSIFTW